MSSYGEKSSESNDSRISLEPIKKKLWLKIYEIWFVFVWIFQILLEDYI